MIEIGTMFSLSVYQSRTKIALHVGCLTNDKSVLLVYAYKRDDIDVGRWAL